LVSGLRSPEFAAFRREQLRRDRALSRPITPVDPSPYCPSPAHVDLPAGRWGWPGTTQLVAADIEGNMASVITAVGWDYGSLVFVEELGIFLNNAMSYFDPRPGRRASIAPGKTPMFGAPALVATGPDGQGIALAGSGGYRIQTAVLHALSGRVDFGLPLDQAIERPRVHCQGRQTVVDARIPAEIRRQLTERGHEVLVVEENPATWHFGRVCGVEVSSGSVRGSAGPVWDTAARAL
jgi:gamma-glutamyltranspeptidase/glutathione hydrolase